MGKELLEILYRDEHLVAINKPTGLLVHRSSIDRRETRFAVQLLRNQLGQRVYPVHRLDKPTSGVLLFALSGEMAGRLARDFAEQLVKKRYLAVVRGWPEEQGEINYPLVDGPEWGRQSAPETPRPAVTRYRTLARSEVPFAVGRYYPQSRYALLETFPQTGRRHQIRRHFKHIFHPLIGDTRYGEGRHNRLFRDHFAAERLLLHAQELVCNHPCSGDRLTITAPLPADFQQTLVLVGLSHGLAMERSATEGVV